MYVMHSTHKNIMYSTQIDKYVIQHTSRRYRANTQMYAWAWCIYDVQHTQMHNVQQPD